MRRYTIPVTTDASGNATVYTPRLRGKLRSISYVKTDFANGVDFTITNETTGEGYWTQNDVNASAKVSPRQPLHDAVGAALLYAAGGTAQVSEFGLSGDRIKIVIAQGGATKTGTFLITIE